MLEEDRRPAARVLVAEGGAVAEEEELTRPPRRVPGEEARHGRRLGGGEAVRDQRAVEAGARRRPMKWREVDHALPGGGEAAVGGAVLGVGHGEVVAEQVDAPPRRAGGARPASATSKRFAGSSTMLSRGLADLVEQPARGVGASDDVGELGLDAELDAVALGDGERLLHLGEEVAPGLGRGVVGMPAPLVVGVAGAGAERDEPVPIAGAGGGEDREPAQALAPHRRVGVDHVVGAGHGGDARRRSRPRRRRSRSAAPGGDRRRAWRRGRGRPC